MYEIKNSCITNSKSPIHIMDMGLFSLLMNIMEIMQLILDAFYQYLLYKALINIRHNLNARTLLLQPQRVGAKIALFSHRLDVR